MKAAWSLLAVVALAVPVYAEDEKKDEAKTLKGTICCAKCELKKEKACYTVIKVKEGDKEVIYYFDEDAHKKNHKAICTEAKEGTVTGTIGKKDGKMWVTVKELKFAE